jgi:hypothetical protein
MKIDLFTQSMRFTLELCDRNGAPLNEGDYVRVSDGKQFHFYAEVKYLEDENIITPFHTFSFISFEKVDKVPDNAIKSNEERYSIYYLADPEDDESGKDFNNYLMDWRICEHHLETRTFKINKICS